MTHYIGLLYSTFLVNRPPQLPVISTPHPVLGALLTSPTTPSPHKPATPIFWPVRFLIKVALGMFFSTSSKGTNLMKVKARSIHAPFNSDDCSGEMLLWVGAMYNFLR